MRLRVRILFTLAAAHAAGPAAAASALSPSSLRTDGLNFGDDLARIYVGDFGRVGFDKGSTELSILVSQYMSTFSRSCASELPKDKVEIMAQECAREEWTVNGYGVEQPGSRRCVDYRTVGTGRYADPQVYRLHQRLDASMTSAMMGGMFGAMKQGGDAASGVRRMTDIAIYAKNDIPKLVQANGCASPALMRLQANLLRFGEGKDPIVMPGGVAGLADPGVAAGGPGKEQNFQRLLDDLITEQSQAWMMNRYLPGSVRPGLPTRDPQGRPRQVGASYSYMAMGKTYAGRLSVTFDNAGPQCLYFSDLPESCRVPSPRIVSAYRKNQYAGEWTPEPAPPAVAAAPAVRPRAEGAAPARGDPATRARSSPADGAPGAQAGEGIATPSASRAERAASDREAAREARAVAQLDRQAMARERRCASLRSSIERARAAAADATPQRFEAAMARIERAELSYAQQCIR